MAIVIPDNIKALVYKLEPGCKEQEISLKALSVFLKKNKLTIRDVVAFTDELEESRKKTADVTSALAEEMLQKELSLKAVKNKYEKLLTQAHRNLEDMEAKNHKASLETDRLNNVIKDLNEKAGKLARENKRLSDNIANQQKLLQGKSRKKIIAVTFAVAASFVAGMAYTGKSIERSYPVDGSAARAERQVIPEMKFYYIKYAPANLWGEISDGEQLNKIRALDFGDRVQVEVQDGQTGVERRQKWVKVKTDHGSEGFLYAEQLVETKPILETDGRNTQEQHEQKPKPPRYEAGEGMSGEMFLKNIF